MNEIRIYHPDIMKAVYDDKPFYFQGHWFRAIELMSPYEFACDLCDVPSECNPELAYVCSEIESFWGGSWLLKLLG